MYFISQGDTVPLWDMINHILRAADLPPVRRSMPRRMAWSRIRFHITVGIAKKSVKERLYDCVRPSFLSLISKK